MRERLRILFVCSRNRWRSPTAEAIYRDDPRVEVRSAGVRNSAKRRVSFADIEWAYVVLAMEHSQATQLKEMFQPWAHFPPVHSLDIPDDYPFMDPELMELIRTSVEPFISG